MKIVFLDALDPLHSHDGGMLGFEGLSLWPPNLGLLRDSRSGTARPQLKVSLYVIQDPTPNAGQGILGCGFMRFTKVRHITVDWADQSIRGFDVLDRPRVCLTNAF